ncbi:MAG: ABC transporter ATP-binding protein [Armatimonadota bacterium]|nr:ABC transporter ATP-binding protein [Armatimonadota bacterium]
MTGPLEEKVLVAEGLTKRYGKRQVVDGVSLEVRRGDVFGFLGPNGAGKSTTIRILTGLVRPEAGRVFLFGHDLSRAHHRALARVGAVVEAPSLYQHLSGERNLTLLASLSGGVSRRRLQEVLRLVGLAGRERDRVRTYSHGMKQRLALAAALLPNPELVILDEPTNGLDPGGMVEVRELIRRLSREAGITLFLSSHLLNEVEQVCNRVAVIDQGRVVAQGDVAALLRGSDCLCVHVEPVERAREILAGMPGLGEIGAGEDGWLRIAAPAERAAEVNAALVQGGCRVSALVPRRQSLEEFFLERVGKR